MLYGAEAAGVRRIRNLIERLPSMSRVAGLRGWTQTDDLLAANAELTHAVYRAVLASIPTKHPKQLPKPLRIPRPWDKPKSKVSWMRDMARRALNG